METNPLPVGQAGLPEVLPDVIGFAGTLVLVLVLVAVAGAAYRHFTGGIEWPDEELEEDDGVRQGDEDEEWDYY